ncbi:MAG TPA: homocysteine S-methyltransferase family protein [Candidatus Saccharimonadales bacterium]|nr:homocysteine S-methyltransferase family protein [Candidatus Saccharimonadales bacterium]
MSNSKPATANRFLQRLQQGPVICAEGYVFELERRGYLQAGAYVPEVVLEHPEVVSQLHDEFVRAGSDVVVALTYYAHREKLKVVGRENDVAAINRKALELAKKAAAKNDCLVAGNICNTWAYQPDDPEAAAEVRRQYTEQVGWAVEAGVDFVLAETIEYVGEALIALEVIKAAALPAVVNFSAIYDKSKDGYDWINACKLLEEKGADVVGFNCARGPETMLPLGRKLCVAVDGPIALVPVPYHTTAEAPAFQFLKRREGDSAYTIGLDQHYIDRLEAADFAHKAEKIGVNFIGLCCGAGPHHIRAVAEALGRKPAASKYSADMKKHGLLGDTKTVKQHEKEFLKLWK